MQWNLQNSDDFKNVWIATHCDTATKHEVQKYDPKIPLISNFRYYLIQQQLHHSLDIRFMEF